MIPSITNTPSPPGVSDRGVESPQGIPVASIVVRYTVASDSSRVGNDGWARVRYTSCGPSPFFDRGRGTRPVDLNWGRYLAGWSSRILSSLRKFLQEPRGVLSVLFSPYLSVRFIHASKHGASDVGKIPNSFGVENEFR
jgi:hypothetical protein